MSKKLVLALVLLGAVGACAQQPAPITPQTPTVQPEPVYRGKYGAN